MRIAIPLFGSRVSPRFDCAQIFLIVTVEIGRELQRLRVTAANWTPAERIAELRALAVDTIICGGIDRRSAESLRSSGIDVQNAVTGDADEALANWIRSKVMA